MTYGRHTRLNSLDGMKLKCYFTYFMSASRPLYPKTNFHQVGGPKANRIVFELKVLL